MKFLHKAIMYQKTMLKTFMHSNLAEILDVMIALHTTINARWFKTSSSYYGLIIHSCIDVYYYFLHVHGGLDIIRLSMFSALVP